MDFLKRAEELYDWLVTVRRDIHSHPELSFEERRTSALVASFLEEWGYVVRPIGGTGVHGVLKRVAGSPVAAIRADMDALPIEEESGVPFASVYPGKMHACGHDIHTTCALGAARMLSEAAAQGLLPGGVVLLFQPAEELNKGAETLLLDGALASPKVDILFALHNHPSYPAGSIAVREGAQMAAVDTLKIAVQGRGSHGAIPHESNDPFPAVASLIMNLQTIVSRNMDPQEPAVLSFGSIHGGAANNVIPEHIALTGTIRSFSPEARDLLHERVREIAQGTAEAFRCPIHVDIRRDLPAVLNDPLSYRCCVQAAKDIVGAERVVSPVPSMGGEDFALFQQIVPGCMFWLGVRNETIDARYPWHSPRFTADESALPVGAAVLARSAVLAMEALSSQA